MNLENLTRTTVECLQAMTADEREAVQRSFNAVNLMLPENAALWAQMLPYLSQNLSPLTPQRLDALRTALDGLPPASWAAINNAIFVMHRGNVFDERYERVPGGGIHFEFVQRYQRFLADFDAEARRVVPLTDGRQLSVLDVGCWQGTLLCTLLQRGCRVAGTDLGNELKETICERVSWLRVEDAERFDGFYSGLAHEVVPTLGRYDLVTCQETLEHVPSALLQATCDSILQAAIHSVLITVPGWDDSWPLHLRVFTVEQLASLLRADRHNVEFLQLPGSGVYTTVRVRVRR